MRPQLLLNTLMSSALPCQLSLFFASFSPSHFPANLPFLPAYLQLSIFPPPWNLQGGTSLSPVSFPPHTHTISTFPSGNLHILIFHCLFLSPPTSNLPFICALLSIFTSFLPFLSAPTHFLGPKQFMSISFPLLYLLRQIKLKSYDWPIQWASVAKCRVSQILTP